MTDEGQRHPTDEPDGTPAYQASLRGPGASLQAGEAAQAGEDTEDTGDSGSAAGPGYDADAVSGDTGMYRPD